MLNHVQQPCSPSVRSRGNSAAPVSRFLHQHCSQRASPLVAPTSEKVNQLAKPILGAKASVVCHTAVLNRPATVDVDSSEPKQARKLRVLIAGAGIGGLVLAVALLRKGIDVQIFERDMTAIRGEGKYRGPIQIQSNALAALEAVDPECAEEILKEGCITGDRINGLCDGETGDWYVKFDTFHPAVTKGLPVTRVVSRVTLQEILAKTVEKYGGPNTILGSSHVISQRELEDPVTGLKQVEVQLEDGRRFTGDMLVGADGIWSKIRKSLVGDTQPNFSGYTCYTGISDFIPADIDIVGYRVFLGNGKYFVSSDVGGGKMQWYAFHKEAADGTDEPGQRKSRLLQIFGHWCDHVTDLIKATPEDDVLRRDIYDRPPIFTWAKGRVALLGDSAHAMQPNLGQGGCMAIEDAFELAQDLSQSLQEVDNDVARLDIERVLSHYQNQRMMRASTIHGMAGMAAIMASTYKAYLGEGLGPLSWITKFHIPHPGRVAGQLAMKLTMPTVLGWVLGGNVQHLEGSRVPSCRLTDKAQWFEEEQYAQFLVDDEVLVHAAHADWMLVCERGNAADSTTSVEYKGVYIDEAGSVVGREQQAGCSLVVDDVHVSKLHARVWKADGKYYLKDLGSRQGTWVNGRQIKANSNLQLHPGDVVEFGRHPSHETYRVKMQHVTLRNNDLSGFGYTTMIVGKPTAPMPVQA